jgi:uncharacterized HAD superfamily protein
MKCFIFDIDGTIANDDHRLHYIKQNPKDWTAYFATCGGDAPIAHIVELAKACHERCAIIYVSGRSDECRELTESWLVEHGLPFGHVYMRKAGDHRNDDVIKIEMLAQLRADNFEPIMAFDDRDRVVAAWRTAGVPCAQVAPGDF